MPFPKGKPAWNRGIKGVFHHSSKTKERISISHTGKPKSLQHRIAMSLARRGERSHRWKGGISPIHHRIRESVEYKLWRESVFKRDNWTCKFCGTRGGKLEPDHIKPFALFPELRFAIDNGRTLCVACHRKTDTFGYKTYIKKYGT